MKFPFFCLLKEFPRDHDQAFAGSRPATLLLALILLPLSYVLGAFAATVIPSVPASADGNWGLSFQQEGKPPVANATADELKQYNAWYADLSGEKVIYLTFDAGGDSSQYFALRVRGESMLNAGILPDDLVVVRQQQTANNGEIVVALLGDEATVKRYSRRNGQVWLLPENEAYSPIDGHDAQILGKVAAVIRRY